MLKKSTVILLLLFTYTMSMFLFGCSESPKENADQAYIKTINDWDARRAENLKKKTGWLNLAGLFWLKNGENKLGSGKDNDIVFPAGKADEYVGSFILADGKVTIKINDGIIVTSDGENVNEMVAQSDTAENTTVFNHKNLSWFVIIRGEKIGIRLRDYDSELVKNFTKIDRFPIDTSWIIKAKFQKFVSPKKFIVPNILGTFEEEEAEGEIVFNKNGEDFSIVPIATGDKYFIIFADKTSGVETYGAGRFLYTDKADENGDVVLDFNKAYNPPCAFTKYATCPIPPKENHLKLAVTAGEKNWGHH